MVIKVILIIVILNLTKKNVKIITEYRCNMNKKTTIKIKKILKKELK